MPRVCVTRCLLFVILAFFLEFYRLISIGFCTMPFVGTVSNVVQSRFCLSSVTFDAKLVLYIVSVGGRRNKMAPASGVCYTVLTSRYSGVFFSSFTYWYRLVTVQCRSSVQCQLCHIFRNIWRNTWFVHRFCRWASLDFVLVWFRTRPGNSSHCNAMTSHRPELWERLFLDSDSGGHARYGDEYDVMEFLRRPCNNNNNRQLTTYMSC